MRRFLIASAVALLPTALLAQATTLRASWSSGTQVAALFWNSVAGANTYQICESTAYPTWNCGTTTALSTAYSLPLNSAAIFRLQPLDGSGNPLGAPALAVVTGYVYTDDPLPALAPKTVHITDLRSAINLLRVAAGLTATSWSRALHTNDYVQANDVAELRGSLDQALQHVGLSSPAYVDPALNNTVTIKKIHIQQLRMRVRSFPETVTVSGLAMSNPYFSPNGDGQKDTTTLSATVTAVDYYSSPTFFRWQVNVRNGGGTVLRSVTGVGSTVGYTWDGKDGSGVVQPEGAYTVEIVDLDGATSAVASATTTIDLTPPAVALSSPTNGQTTSNVLQNGSAVVQITGTATDAHFASWAVSEDGAQSATGTTSSVSSSWDLATVPNGSHTVTLSATDQAANTASTSVSVTASNFSASQNQWQMNPATDQVTFTSVIPFTLTETLVIKDSTGNTVRTLFNGSRNAGTQTDVWNGTNDAGQVLPDGTYKYIATATSGSNSMTWDQSTQYIGTTVTQFPYVKCLNSSSAIVPCTDSSLVFDPYMNKPLTIIYCVGGGDLTSPTTCGPDPNYGSPTNVPAYVSVVTGTTAELSSTCSSANCVLGSFTGAPSDPFGYQSAGAHQVVWFGRSYDGSTDLSANQYMTVIRRTDAWPRNLTLLFGNAPTITAATISPVVLNPGSTVVGNGQTVTVSYTSPQSRPVTVTAQYRNIESGSVLRTITATATSSPATLTWDGRADSGNRVAPGWYEVVLNVSSTGGTSPTWRPLAEVQY